MIAFMKLQTKEEQDMTTIEDDGLNSTKGNLGHTVGAAGAIEVAVTALSVKNDTVHANLSEDLIENLNIATDTTPMKINHALSTSFGFGGHNAAILLKKCNP